jgi:hypothetical protein
MNCRNFVRSENDRQPLENVSGGLSEEENS